MEENHIREQNLLTAGGTSEFKTSQLEDQLNEKLEEAFHKQTSQVILHDVAKIACEHDPIDLAHAVTRLPARARIIVYDNLPDLNAKIIFMIHTGNNTRSAIFKQLDDQSIKDLISGMPVDDAVWVLDDLSDRRLKRIFELLDPGRANRIRELQQHDRQSAGRLMTNEFFAFKMSTTIGEVATQVRNNPGIELTGRVFVLNDEGKVVGFVPERNLIVNPPYLPIRQVMRPILHSIPADASRDEMVDLVERYNISALPVINEEGHLEGVVTYEDAVEAMKDIADQTVASIAGTSEDYEEYEPVFNRVLWRAPWLLVTLCAGLTTASAMAYFNTSLWFVIVPFFVPLINGMSGNVGIQCSSLLVRAMATGTVSPTSFFESVSKEFLIGGMIGLLFGLSCGILVYFLNFFGFYQLDITPIAMGTTVSAGVLAACLVATLLGSISPFFFARFRIDPAVAAGPIVTAFNDLLSTLMFFLVARTVYLVIGGGA